MGGLFHSLNVNLHLSYEQIGELSFPQIRCLQHEGKPPRGNVRKFGSMAEAEEYRKQARERGEV